MLTDRNNDLIPSVTNRCGRTIVCDLIGIDDAILLGDGMWAPDWYTRAIDSLGAPGRFLTSSCRRQFPASARRTVDQRA